MPAELIHLVEHLDGTAINASNIRSWTGKDPVLARVRKYLMEGWPNQELEEEFRAYRSRSKELSVQDGCILWGVRVVVPPPGRSSVLDELHETHTGMSKMKSLARSYIWWPGMDADIEQCVKQCSNCQEMGSSQPTAQLHPWEWPAQPWSRLHLDFAGPFMNCMYLVLVDAHSKWLDVKIMKDITTATTVKSLREIFATHGIPRTIVTDNGPSFTSEEFTRFMKVNGIRHITSAPYHPSTNGLAERGVQTMKNGLKQMQSGTVEEKLAKFLFKYRITPHTTTGVPPSELLMGRKLRSRLDLLFPDVSNTVTGRQLKQKELHDKKKGVRIFKEGDPVYVEDFSTSRHTRWIPGVVRKVTGPLSYQVDLENGSMVRRHVDSVKARETKPPDSIEQPELTNQDMDWDFPCPAPIPTEEPPPTVENSTTPNPVNSETTDSLTAGGTATSGPVIRRSIRTHRTPTRYGPYVSH